MDNSYNFDEEKPLTDINKNDPYGDEGVIYEPSGNARRMGERRSSGMNNGKTPKKKKKKAPKSTYRIFLLLSLIFGVIVCGAAFSFVYNYFSEKTSKSADEKEETVNYALSASELIANKESNMVGQTFTGVIKELDRDNNQFTFYLFSENQNYTFKLTGTTDTRDKYGEPLTAGEFDTGDIVDIVFDEDKKLVSMVTSAQQWEYTEINNFKVVNQDQRYVGFEGQNYKYNDLTRVTRDDSPYDMTKIDPMDIVTIKGYSNTVYSIEVVKSHGILKIINKESIRDGVIEIDTDVHKNLSDFTEMKIHEGKHKVVVKGSNCEPFSQEILINQDEDYQLDLSSIQIKTGVLIVTANVKDVTLTVNGKTEKMGEPLILDYGTYKVKVTKDEYHDYEEDVKVDKNEIKIKAELKKIVKKGKLTVSSTPNGADLYVDNSKVGITPVSVEVDRGTHTITVRKLGYKDFYLSSVDIGEKESVYNVELQSDVTTSSQSVNTSPDIQNNTQNDSQGTNQNNLQNNTQNSTQNNTQNNTPNNTVQDNEPSNANGANQPSDALSDNQPVISENEQQSGQ